MQLIIDGITVRCSPEEFEKLMELRDQRKKQKERGKMDYIPHPVEVVSKSGSVDCAQQFPEIWCENKSLN